MRQSGRKTNATRPASGKGKSAARDPNRRPSPSKPALLANDATALARPATEATGWTAAHDLAPGLHLVATPIGNLGDVTLRALWVLRHVDRILCEDTRVTGRLLARYGIATPLDSYHDHNADRVRPAVLERLRRGERLALVSDAGMPLVSDPGYKLVRDALAEGLPVTAAPGPSAALTALVLSGLPPDTFLFAGFLPSRQAARQGAIARWRDLDATLVLFEAPARLAATLADLAAILGARDAAVARELTKRHEELRRGTLTELAEHYRAGGAPRGEAVIVVGPPASAAVAAPEDLDGRLADALARLSLRDAVAELTVATGLPRAEVYRRALGVRRRR